ncbi:MAG: LuxR C-terminal-related transcriptional regulator [Streptosporangiales bacterium]|nr:LuxR C-terminal-related transcriptional regulator [Streptosporangiales bacterium]
MGPEQFNGVVSRMLSDDLLDRCAGVLDLTRWRIASDCVALVAIDAPGARPGVVSESGYPPGVAEAVTSDAFMVECRELQKQLLEEKAIYAWEDVGFADSRFAQEVLVPEGFRNGVSVPLRGAAGELVGMLHASTVRTRLPCEAKDAVLAIRPQVTALTSAILETRRASLTPREREVLGLVREGLCNHEIASRMYVAERTVATHVERILRKTGTPNRVSAAIWALRHHL